MRRTICFALASLLFADLLGALAASPATAGDLLGEDWCDSNGGIWEGPNEHTGTCWYDPEHPWTGQICTSASGDGVFILN